LLKSTINLAHDQMIGADRYARLIESKRSPFVCGWRADDCNVQSQIVIRNWRDSSATPKKEGCRYVGAYPSGLRSTNNPGEPVSPGYQEGWQWRL